MLLKLSTDTTPDEPETGVVLDSPPAPGLNSCTILIGGHWRGEVRLLEEDADEDTIRLIWALLDHLTRRDEEQARAMVRVADEAHHFPSQMDA